MGSDPNRARKGPPRPDARRSKPHRSDPKGSDSNRSDSNRSDPHRNDPHRNEIRKKSEKLAKETGIPHALAWQVARGEMSLNDVLQKLALKDKVESLIRRHDLPRSLATQIAKGQADLDVVLVKRRLEAHLEKWCTHSMLVAAAAHGRPVTLALHGQRWVTGVIEAVEQYEFVFREDGAEASERIHKLQAKLGCEADDARPLRRAIKRDKERDAATEPVWKPQDRYGCSDKRLFGYLDGARAVRVVTLEGEVLTGDLQWMGRWEVGLRLKKGEVVTVFRHAIAELRAA